MGLWDLSPTENKIIGLMKGSLWQLLSVLNSSIFKDIGCSVMHTIYKPYYLSKKIPFQRIPFHISIRTQ